jgi:hypothetical protein
MWSNFITYQLYSPEEVLSKDAVQKVIYGSPSPAEEKKLTPCVGKYFCEASTVEQECDPKNQIRLVKLGDTKAFQGLDQRAAPPSILQRLLLVDQVFPTHNFYFKVQLRVGVTDEFFLPRSDYTTKNVGKNFFTPSPTELTLFCFLLPRPATFLFHALPFTLAPNLTLSSFSRGPLSG